MSTRRTISGHWLDGMRISDLPGWKSGGGASPAEMHQADPIVDFYYSTTGPPHVHRMPLRYMYPDHAGQARPCVALAVAPADGWVTVTLNVVVNHSTYVRVATVLSHLRRRDRSA